MFTTEDISQLESQNISLDQLQHQVESFKKGFKSPNLVAPATLDNGIKKFSREEQVRYSNLYETSKKATLKFVPASGAATRMFKPLFEFLDSNHQNETIDTFFKRLKEFAFYSELKQSFKNTYGYSWDETQYDKKYQDAIRCLLLEEGLSYGSLPKGLLSFHRYENGSRTPLEEHIQEGISYANNQGTIKLHFTVSPKHHDLFVKKSNQIISNSEQIIDVDITYSFQKPSTNTLAVDLENNPFREQDGSILFRPAGHGALLENLNKLDADIIFIKNIDNVVPDKLKEDTIFNKKMLAGVLVKYQEKAFDLLKRFDNGENVEQEALALLDRLGCKGELSYQEAMDKLNRPIRVCGMVKNEGEPGGGPFWVEDKGVQSLQIVESAQVDLKNSDQAEIFKQSTHFNPVDLVCGVRNYRGKKFDLIQYRNDDLGMIAEKSSQGRMLKAMELPGLWNGSMADWNTIFVEVPLSTFNPVKTVMDLLKEAHQ